MPLTCYYAHCVAIYDTPQEERDMKTLMSLGFEVHNPNTPEAQKLYKELKDMGENAMDMFQDIVRKQDVFAFRANPDGSIPSGVHKELMWAIESGRIIIELPNGCLRRGLTYPETKEYLFDIGER